MIPRCLTCQWFQPYRSSIRCAETGEAVGGCRLSPPSEKGWPIVTVNDFCGAHRPIEAAAPSAPSIARGAS